MKRALGLFIGVAFGYSWSVSEAYYRLLGPTAAGDIRMPVLYMAGPALGALAATRWGLRQPLRSLGPVWAWSPWLLVAWFAPLPFAVAHVLLALALPGVSLNVDSASMAASILDSVPAEHRALATTQLASLGDGLIGVVALQLLLGGLLAGATINALVSFGEELGWRGFLQRYLPQWGFWRGSALVGVLWGLWHLPLIARGHNYPDHPGWGIGMMVAFCLLLAPLFAHVRARAGSVLAPSIMHGTLNATAGVTVFLAGGGDLLTGPAGLSGLTALALANAALAWVRRRDRAMAGGATAAHTS